MPFGKFPINMYSKLKMLRWTDEWKDKWTKGDYIMHICIVKVEVLGMNLP